MRQITYRDFIEVGKIMKKEGTGKTVTFIEALDAACENNFLFPKEAFISALSEYLFHNGVIREASLYELCKLDSNVMAKFGRNYRMLDLFDGCASLYMIREELPRTSLELRSTNNVFPFTRPAS